MDLDLTLKNLKKILPWTNLEKVLPCVDSDFTLKWQWNKNYLLNNFHHDLIMIGPWSEGEKSWKDFTIYWQWFYLELRVKQKITSYEIFTITWIWLDLDLMVKNLEKILPCLDSDFILIWQWNKINLLKNFDHDLNMIGPWSHGEKSWKDYTRS